MGNTLEKTVNATVNTEKSVEDLPQAQKEILKSVFTTGYGVSPDTQVDAAALRVENLDDRIKNLTWGEEDFTIVKDIDREVSTSTVQKYVTFLKHGRIGSTLFQPEIGISNVNSPRLKQKQVNMKYIVDVRQQSMVSNLVRNIESPTDINLLDSMLVVTKTIEWAIFYGDADMTAEGEGQGLEFDGIAKLMNQNNVVDVHGQSLTPEVLNYASTVIGKYFGVATDAYMPIGVKADFSNQFLGAQRIVIPSQEGSTFGVNADKFLSARGNIRLNGSTIMDNDAILDTDAELDPSAPQAPKVTAKVEADKGGLWLDKDAKYANNITVEKEVGVEQEYRVTLTGTSAVSAPSEVIKATPANATDGITLTISINSIQRSIPSYASIYRKGKLTGEFYLIKRIPMSQMDDATGNLTFTDIDERMPETADVFILERRPTVLSLLELLPTTKVNLPTVTTATQFMLLWFGALKVSNPNRIVRVKNVRYVSGNENYMRQQVQLTV